MKVNQEKNDKVVAALQVNKIVNGYKEQLGLDVEHFFSGLESVYLLECKTTKRKYFMPKSIAGNGDFYTELQNFSWYYQKDKWEFKIAKQIIEYGNILEIGCGTGEFLSSILNNKDIVIKGTDFNDEVVRICKRKGLDVENIDIEDIKSETYDYIVAFQVLEHLNDVNHFFSECKRILKPSGKIIIGVPNCKSFVFSPFSDFYFEHGSLILNLPPHHMNWWTKKSLMLAGKNHGFKLNKCYFEPLPDFRKTLVDNNLRALIKIKVIHRIFRKLLYKRYNSIFKGETILVVLEKQENV